jgi:hypothetical protein
VTNDLKMSLVFGDTDSVMIALTNISPKEVKQLLEDKINQVFTQGVPNSFKLATEEIAVRYYAPQDVKKCYSKIIYKPPTPELAEELDNGVIPEFPTLDFTEILDDPVYYLNHTFKTLYPNCSLKNKSFSWSTVPSAQLPYFKALSLAILCCDHTVYSMQQMYEQIINKLYNDIYQCIKNKDIKALTEYSLKVKTLRVPHITEKYPDIAQQNDVHIVWLDEKNKDNKHKSL